MNILGRAVMLNLALVSSVFVTAVAQDDDAAVATRITYAFRHAEMLPRNLLADKIEVRHVPALPNDPEIVDKANFGKNDLAALKRAMKNFHMDVMSMVPSDNVVVVTLALSGTRASGIRYSSKMLLRFVLARGLIAGLEVAQDPGERAMLEEIEGEGGFHVLPPGAQPR